MKNKLVSASHAPTEIMPDNLKQIAELNGLLSSVITTIQGQTDVNSALTIRVLSLENKITQLDGRLQRAERSGS
jgi:hypothetical protein